MIKKGFVFLMFIVSSACLSAQNDFEYEMFDNEIKLDVFPLFNNTFGVAYEHYFHQASSVMGKASFILMESSYENRMGAKVEGQYRFYAYSNDVPIDMYFSGLFFAPFLQYEYIDFVESPDNIAQREHYFFSSVRGGILAGLQFFLYERFVLEVSLGGGIKYTIDETPFVPAEYSGDVTDPGYNGIVPKGHALFGVRF